MGRGSWVLSLNPRKHIGDLKRFPFLRVEEKTMEMEKGTGTGATIDLNKQKRDEDGMMVEVEDLSGRVHQLPCCVKYDGAAPAISHYFKPKPSGAHLEDGSQLQEAHFRGRLLQGTTIPLPHPYSGFVLGKKKWEDDWHTNATFRDITYWNHDDIPCNNDNFFRAFHWLTVATALHNPVTPEDLASSSTAL